MNDFRETIFLQESFVKVTNLRTVIGTKIYSMTEITSVDLTTRAKSYRSLLLVPVGILLMGWGIIDHTRQFVEFLSIGVVLSLVGISLFIIARPTYAVEIGSTYGEKSILRSTNLIFTQKVVDAMKSAIAHNG